MRPTTGAEIIGREEALGISFSPKFTPARADERGYAILALTRHRAGPSRWLRPLKSVTSTLAKANMPSRVTRTRSVQRHCARAGRAEVSPMAGPAREKRKTACTHDCWRGQHPDEFTTRQHRPSGVSREEWRQSRQQEPGGNKRGGERDRREGRLSALSKQRGTHTALHINGPRAWPTRSRVEAPSMCATTRPTTRLALFYARDAFYASPGKPSVIAAADRILNRTRCSMDY